MRKQFTGYRILLGQKVCKFMLELHSNNHLNSLTLNEDTYEKSFEKTGVTENESYGCNSHVTQIFLLILIDKCLPHALVFLNTEYHM